MKKLSIKYKLTIIIAAVITGVIFILCLFNLTFFEKYYIGKRKDTLIDSYEKMKKIIVEKGLSDEDIRDEMLNISRLHNINVFVVDSNWKTAYSTQNNAEYTYRWLQKFMFSNDKSIEVISDNNNYTIKKGYDGDSRLSYMVIYGTLQDGTQIVMQIVIESIHENVTLFNRFIMYVGIGVLIVSIAVIYYVSYKFTKPVNELSRIAREMSDMNFDVKYTGKYNDEIGVLGNSMNKMSESLKKNIAMLKNANYELRRDNEAKTRMADRQKEFLANVSHELKTPIALIQGYAEGLKEGVATDSESIEFYCSVIADEAEKMNHMVKNLLSLDRIESGNKEIDIERFSLTELIKTIVRLNGIRLSQNNITVNTDIAENIYVWYDEMQIEEVFTNFFTNAINHSDGIINISCHKNGNRVKTEIYNSGEKIPEEDMEHIWEKLYKVDKARTREYGGNGIGLSIVKAIMDSYGTEYGAVNKENGVSFYFELECE